MLPKPMGWLGSDTGYKRRTNVMKQLSIRAITSNALTPAVPT